MSGENQTTLCDDIDALIYKLKRDDNLFDARCLENIKKRVQELEGIVRRCLGGYKTTKRARCNFCDGSGVATGASHNDVCTICKGVGEI